MSMMLSLRIIPCLWLLLVVQYPLRSTTPALPSEKEGQEAFARLRKIPFADLKEIQANQEKRLKAQLKDLRATLKNVRYIPRSAVGNLNISYDPFDDKPCVSLYHCLRHLLYSRGVRKKGFKSNVKNNGGYTSYADAKEGGWTDLLLVILDNGIFQFIQKHNEQNLTEPPRSASFSAHPPPKKNKLKTFPEALATIFPHYLKLLNAPPTPTHTPISSLLIHPSLTPSPLTPSPHTPSSSTNAHTLTTFPTTYPVSNTTHMPHASSTSVTVNPVPSSTAAWAYYNAPSTDPYASWTVPCVVLLSYGTTYTVRRLHPSKARIKTRRKAYTKPSKKRLKPIVSNTYTDLTITLPFFASPWQATVYQAQPTHESKQRLLIPVSRTRT